MLCSLCALVLCSFILLFKRLKPPYGSFLAFDALASSSLRRLAASGKALSASVSAATARVPIALKIEAMAMMTIW